jgi:endoglucanase
MTSGAPDYTVDPVLFRLLDYAVDWAEKYQIYIILDNHTFHPSVGLSDDIDKVLIPVWSQVARRYANRSDYVVYEILNEPHGISDRRWGEVQGMAINAIRAHDQKHWIIVGGTNYNSYMKLPTIPNYNDDKLIYTFHYYDPFLFTHQGASWSPPLEYAANIPFPADPQRMPRIPSRLRGTWVENTYRNYRNDASPRKMMEVLDYVVNFSRRRGVPVFCGEYGVFMPVSPPLDRVIWYEYVTNALDRRNISRASWDYFGGFGIFNYDGRGDFFSDVNVEVVRAMGFTAPLQAPRSSQPLGSGFVIYDDFAGENISTGFWGDDQAVFSFFETDRADGQFAITLANAGQYNSFWFAFPRNGNFSLLAEEGYFLEFKARTDKPVRFDVRFLMPESETSLPWRIRFIIDENVLPSDGRWHTIGIRLKDMIEAGAWANMTQKWYNPQGGEFRWDNIDRLEFAAEHMDFKGYSVSFDSIRITR